MPGITIRTNVSKRVENNGQNFPLLMFQLSFMLFTAGLFSSMTTGYIIQNLTARYANAATAKMNTGTRTISEFVLSAAVPVSNSAGEKNKNNNMPATSIGDNVTTATSTVTTKSLTILFNDILNA